MLGAFFILLLTAVYANCQLSSESVDNNIIDTPTITTPNEEYTGRISEVGGTIPQNTNTDLTTELYNSSLSEIVGVTNEEETEIAITTETITKNENQDETTAFEISTESLIDTSTVKVTSEAQEQTSNFETTEATREIEAIITNTESSRNPLPTITINLPTITTIRTLTTTKHLCEENEVYSCLPWCPRTCNSPLSKLICRPSHNQLCRRGCTCKNGFLYEKTIGKCVKECPEMQLK